MPPEEHADDEQVSPPAAPPAGDGDAGDGASGQEPQTPKEITDARREAANYRTRLRASERELETLKQAQLTQEQRDSVELEELRKFRTAAVAEKRENAFASAVTAAASSAGALYPDRIHRLLADVERDEDGKPIGLTRALADLRREMPALFRANGGAGDIGAGATGTPQAQSDMNAILRGMVGR